MRKDRYNKRKFHSKSLTLVLAISLAFVLVISCSVGATLAWLKDTTTPVVNTFTYGDINITLTETTGNEYKMVPGDTIDKDPLVTVKAGSEDCWVFVKIEESGSTTAGQTFDDFLTYTVDTSKWTLLSQSPDPENNTENEYYIYYAKVSGLTADSAVDKELSILVNDTVTVKDTVTKAMMNAIDGKIYDSNGILTESNNSAELANRPVLKFTAYAIQQANTTSAASEADQAAEAWAKINP